jgi:outer membrane protein OmpA-like peptidoglycan-associated protein
MSSYVKLLVGLVATFVVAAVAFSLNRSPLLSDLGARSAEVMAANGIVDGRASWIGEDGWTYRQARLSGTADAATRARTLAAVAALDGVDGAVWVEAPDGVPLPAPVLAVRPVDCRRDLGATLAANPLTFGEDDARLTPAGDAAADVLAALLRTCRDLHFAIAVHATPSDSPAIGLSLSQSRAEALVEALGRRGLDTRNYEPIGLGATATTADRAAGAADHVEFIYQADDTLREARR